MDAPRGRIALMRAAVNGKISHDEFLHTFAEHITLCLECRACESACPSGVQYGKLIEGARIALEDLRQPGVVERFVSWLGMVQLMPHVNQMKLVARLMWLYEALGVQWLVRTINVLPKPLDAMEGILPPIPARYPEYSRPAPAVGEKRGTVAFFYGCIQEAFLGAINAATIRVLQRNGYEVHFPQAQTCCGAAQWHSGGEDLAQDLARQNIDAFEDFDVVINNAGGCGLTLKEYPDLLHDDPDYAERAEAFADKVQDFSEFMIDNLHVPPQGALGVRATYSDSCHLRHGQGVIDEPRALLRGIPGLELVELAHPERCCGSAGIYNIVQSETATAVLDAKMEDIAATGAEVVVTSNTGCHMQLVSGVRRARLNAKVLHVAEMLDLSYMVEERNGNGAAKKAEARLSAPVKHPKPLFGQRALPEHWLDWQARRLKRDDADTPLASLRADLEPGQVVDNPVDLLTYVVDGGLDQGNPVGVVFPYAPEDVQAIVQWGRDHKVPVVARGAGTGLAGGAVALRGGLILQFSHMKQLLDLDLEGRSAVAQPGLVNQTLDQIAKGQGLYFPPDPASGRAATVGGNVGANAGGPHCFKYGVTTNYVTGLKVVLADGRLVELGGRALDYPALDLVGLMTGSEGTLAALTEASLRLRRDPPAVKTLLAAFDSVAQAGEAVSAMIAAGLVPATMEMMGQRIMRTIEEYNHPGLPVDAGAALIIDVDGYPASVEPQIEEVAEVLRANGAQELRVAQSEAERDQIWYARKSAAGAMARLAVDHYTVDGSVPRSKLAETLREVIRICDEMDLEVLFLLHAGDGNLHPMVLVPDPEDEAFLERLHEGGRMMAELFVEMGGAISGEHGIGIEKQEFMPLMFNEEELSAMREIKDIFDPDELLNPGKVFPKAEATLACEIPLETAQPLDLDAELLAPETPEAASHAICGLIASGRSIRVRGGGTKSQPFAEAEVTMSTAGLNGIRTYARDDLYVTAGAGTPLAALQAALAKDDMWVPLVSPWADATVGGIVATAFNAPLRMLYGGLRDLVLALTVTLPDGRVLRAGRPVMKNVAGYDLVKLFVGSYGTLGLITDVTFKLSARPRCSRTLAVPVPAAAEGVTWAQRLRQASLVASAVLLCDGAAVPGLDAERALLYTAEGLPEDVDAEFFQARSLLQSLNAPEPQDLDVTGSQVWASWMGQGTPTAAGGYKLVRLGVPPKDLPDLVRQLEGVPEMDAVEAIADFPNGHLYLRGVFDLARARAAAVDRGGYGVVLQAYPPTDVDLWGYRPEALDMMRAIKARWDPEMVFNTGIFVV
jgi:D-lactate dehydrogenase (cytochrome)